MLAAGTASDARLGKRSLTIANSPASMTLWVEEGKSLRGDMRKEARETLDRHEREGTITILTILGRRRAERSLRTRATCSTWKKEEVHGRRREIL